MKSVTVGELRQNPTRMLAEVEAGEVYRITRHNREIGRITPPGDEPFIVPRKRTGAARTREWDPIEVKTANSIDEVLAQAKANV